MRRIRHSSRPRAGNAIIEFGVAFPMLFSLLLGTFQIGFTLHLYDQLQSTVRNGARYASVADFDSASGGSSFKSSVANMVVYGSAAGGVTPLVTGLRTTAVSVTWLADAAGIPQTVTVKISSYAFSVLGVSYRLTNKPQITFIYQGQFLS
jgi:Flp pilus assembly protein TadG